VGKDIMVAFGVDVDAVAGWLGTYGGEDSPNDISRGVFAGTVGARRLLELFRRFGIPSSWFVPGHSLESFPETIEQVVADGHEIGLHGYSHENPMAMSAEQERDVLHRTLEITERFCGQRPQGYVAPWWELGPRTIELLIEAGIDYDHSMMHDDFHPYFLPTYERWTPIDLSGPAETWMRPLERGPLSDLVEIPASWYLDDLPPMMFIKGAPNSHGFVNPRDIEELWRDQFDWVHREHEYAIFPISIHPDVSGRPQVLLMLERLIEYISSHDGVRFVAMQEIAADFRRRQAALLASERT
jgi:peptidoglycan-N-acetylglucosamine deacetylase